MLAKEMGNEWTYCIDSDTMVHPDCFDFSLHISKDIVCHNGKDLNTIRWDRDEFFLRDGRFIGSCTWNTLASDWCLDIWQPLDLSFADACSRIHITAGERMSGVCEPWHLIDDYTHSRNIARYGLHFKTYDEICRVHGMPGNPYLYHLYAIDEVSKFARMCVTLAGWGAARQDTVMELGRKWGIRWDPCPGTDGRGAHNIGPNGIAQCNICGGSGVANARRV